VRVVLSSGRGFSVLPARVVGNVKCGGGVGLIISLGGRHCIASEVMRLVAHGKYEV